MCPDRACIYVIVRIRQPRPLIPGRCQTSINKFVRIFVGSVIKKRRKRMAKKKHRKLLRKTRHQRRNKK